MSRFLHYSSCPRCRENGKDSRGDNLANYQDGSAHCFACSYHQYPKHYKPINPIKSDGPKSLLPSDFTREVPTEAWKWLLQYGLSYQYWLPKVGFSESSGRLVFKVGDPLAFSIGRLIDTESRGRKWYVWGDSHKHVEVIDYSNSNVDRGSITVITEDLISAHKVGQIAKAFPLFGTAFYPCHYYYLNSVDGRVVLWLDKDQENNVKKIALRLESLINRPVEIMLTYDDPKSLQLNTIKGILNV